MYLYVSFSHKFKHAKFASLKNNILQNVDFINIFYKFHLLNFFFKFQFENDCWKFSFQNKKVRLTIHRFFAMYWCSNRQKPKCACVNFVAPNRCNDRPLHYLGHNGKFVKNVKELNFVHNLSTKQSLYILSYRAVRCPVC